MSSVTNLHEGHRKRTIEKFLAQPDLFPDHELLELLLYFAIPRVDTNPIAHKLISVFGCLSGVFNASSAELTSVEGVGEKTATFILAVGKALGRVNACDKNKVVLKNTETAIKFFKQLFKDDKEQCYVLFLDKSYKVLCQLAFADFERCSVGVDLKQVVNALVGFKPTFAIIAHNHTGKACEPSSADIASNQKLNLLFELHGVKLLDHFIICNSEYYGFKDNGYI